MTCPHKEVRLCPLYVAAHDPELVRFGCDDGRLGEGGCGADRWLDYGRQLAGLRETDAGRRIVEVCEFRAKAEADLAQRRRNRQGNAIH